MDYVNMRCEKLCDMLVRSMHSPFSLKHVFLWQVPTLILFVVILNASIVFVLCSTFLAGISSRVRDQLIGEQKNLKKKLFPTSC